MGPLDFAERCCLLEKAVCSLAFAMLLSCYVCPVRTLLSLSKGRMVSFIQAGYRGIGISDIHPSEVIGALAQKKRVLFSFFLSLEDWVDAQLTSCWALPG